MQHEPVFHFHDTIDLSDIETQTPEETIYNSPEEKFNVLDSMISREIYEVIPEDVFSQKKQCMYEKFQRFIQRFSKLVDNQALLPFLEPMYQELSNIIDKTEEDLENYHFIAKWYPFKPDDVKLQMENDLKKYSIMFSKIKSPEIFK